MHTLDERMQALAESWDWQGQAELMQAELKRHGIENTYIEILGGGAYGVTIPIPALNMTGLVTAEYGLGIYKLPLDGDEPYDGLKFEPNDNFTISANLSLVAMTLNYYLATERENN